MQVINSGQIGGEFGVLFAMARMSAVRYKVKDVWGLEAYSGTSWSQARSAAYQTETLTVYRTINDSWSLTLAILPFTELNAKRNSQAGGGGKGGLNKGPKAASKPGRLKECLTTLLKPFGFKINFDDTKDVKFDRTSGGSFSGTAEIDNLVKGLSPITIQLTTNTSISYNSSTLADIYNRATDRNFGIQSGVTLAENGKGATPKANWIASDIASDSKKYSEIGVQALFIHELGNSIAGQLLGGTAFSGFGVNGYNNKDTDFGTNLEVCVFGKIVGLKTGRLGTKREF